MNYILHLNTFLWKLRTETRLTGNHISLYLALFHYWNCNRFQNPFPLYRERLMQIAGIGSRTTYSKCLKELHDFGYIVHNPSLHRNHRPKVSLVRWKLPPKDDPQLGMFSDNPPKSDPPPSPNMGHLIAKIGTLTCSDPGNTTVKSDPLTCPDVGPNIKQSVNGKHFEREAHTPDPSLPELPSENANQNAPGAETSNEPRPYPRSRDEVLKYFEDMKYPDIEAIIFFNHYQANGWRQAGRIPIKDWKAAADKWMSYTLKGDNANFKPAQHANTRSTQLPGHLRLEQDKNYEDPL
jgi:hypothetical protein